MRTNRFLFTLLIATFTFTLFAQKKVEFGLQGGYSYTMPKLKGDNLSTDLKQLWGNNLSGLNIGPMVRFTINENVGIQSGLLFSYFANSVKNTVVGNNWFNIRTSAYGLDIPIRAEYMYPLADDFYLLLFAGPNLNYAIDKHIVRETVVDGKVASDLTVTKPNAYDSGDYSPFDAQLGFGAGVRYLGITIRASYDFGILDRAKSPDYTLRSNDIKVSLGYYF